MHAIGLNENKITIIPDLPWNEWDKMNVNEKILFAQVLIAPAAATRINWYSLSLTSYSFFYLKRWLINE